MDGSNMMGVRWGGGDSRRVEVDKLNSGVVRLGGIWE